MIPMGLVWNILCCVIFWFGSAPVLTEQGFYISLSPYFSYRLCHRDRTETINCSPKPDILDQMEAFEISLEYDGMNLHTHVPWILQFGYPELSKRKNLAN
jgi:hypothetical protein